MKELEDFTTKQATDFIINGIAAKQKITQKEAKKLFLNAIQCQDVIEAINKEIALITAPEQITFALND